MRQTDAESLYTREQALALAQKVQGQVAAAADVTVAVTSQSVGVTDFALNEIGTSDETSDHRVSLVETMGDRRVTYETNQLDDASLTSAVAKTEAALAIPSASPGASPSVPPSPSPVAPTPEGSTSTLWTDASLALLAPAERVKPAEVMLAAAARAGVVVTGRIEVHAQSVGVLTKSGHFEYGQVSTCGYSVTAQTKDGRGSGWAAWVGEDRAKADPAALVTRAIHLAKLSQYARPAEPGQWTVVLTAEAMGELMRWMTPAFDGERTDTGGMPFSKRGGGNGRNQIGTPVFDHRVTLSADPADPDGGFLPFAYDGASEHGLVHYGPVTWVERGVLKTLAYRTPSAAAPHGLEPVNNSGALRMNGGTQSLEALIASTKEGILVTRFSDVNVVAWDTLTLTGVTQDGVFYIENGKLTNPLKNLRFEDSPLFFLNRLEALGSAKRVAVGQRPYVMPCVRLRDFAFTSLLEPQHSVAP